MSALDANTHSLLTQILRGLQSADNNVRSQAEEVLNNEWVVARPAELLMGLAEQAKDAQDITVRLQHIREISIVV